MKYHDDSTYATNAIAIELDTRKLDFLIPEIFSPLQRIKYALRSFGTTSFIERVAEHISFGDSQGAIVASVEPLLIAAYSSDIDAVVMLKFDQKIQKRYQFKIKDKLVCVNTFGEADEFQSDLIPGQNNSGMWQIVHPIIADLVSSSKKHIEERKRQIGSDGYAYIWQLTQEYLKLKDGVYRDGRPFFSGETME